MSIKWDQFTTGGELIVGSQVVGLSASNLNRRFDFPGTGIKDATGAYLLRWLPSVGTALNYITVSSASMGTSPSIAATGSDTDVGLDLVTQGAGNITLSTSGTGYTIIDSTSAMRLPVGTTAQRPTGLAGLIRYNTTTDVAEFWNGATAQWASNITSVTGTTDRVTVTSGSAAQIDIAPTYIGQSTITTVGTISSGTWAGSTIPVARGGTGLTSVPAHEVVCGGGSGAGPLVTVSGVGDAGQILTSNGPSLLPSWQSGNILGRVTAAPTGYVGEILSNTYGTFAYPGAAAFSNFPTNIITPTLGIGVWLIMVNAGVEVGNGSAITLRLIDSLSNVVLSPGEIHYNVSTFAPDSLIAMTVPYYISSARTVRLQYLITGAILGGQIRIGASISAIRIA